MQMCLFSIHKSMLEVLMLTFQFKILLMMLALIHLTGKLVVRVWRRSHEKLVFVLRADHSFRVIES